MEAITIHHGALSDSSSFVARRKDASCKTSNFVIKKKSMQVVLVVADLKTSINVGMLTFKFLLCPLAWEFRRESSIPSFLELTFLRG